MQVSSIPSSFIFQQVGAPAHTAKLAQDWISTNGSEFIGKDEYPSSLPDVNPLDYHVWGVMLQTLQVQDIMKKSLAVNMEPAAAGLNQQGHILSFTKRLRAYVQAGVDISTNCFNDTEH